VGDSSTFARSEAAFREAVRSWPQDPCERWYLFAGRRARFRIVGGTLADLMERSFAHLRVDSPVQSSSGASEPDLAVDLWDEAVTGVAPDTDLRPDSLGVSPQYDASTDGRFITSVLRFSRSCMDREAAHVVGAVRDARRLTLYEIGRPLHVPLSLWFTDRQVPFVHAGLVADQQAGVLLIGEGGAGKTTSALACLRSGWGYLSDDLAALEIRGDGSAWGHSVYASSFVDRGTIARVGGVPGKPLDGAYPYEDKQLLLLPAGTGGPLRMQARIRAVALLRISASPTTRFHPLRRGETLLEMLRVGLQAGVLHPGRTGLRCLGDVAERVPPYRVDLGTDAAGIPAALRAVLIESQRTSHRGGRR
jgi:hypothetical protein